MQMDTLTKIKSSSIAEIIRVTSLKNMNYRYNKCKPRDINWKHIKKIKVDVIM